MELLMAKNIKCKKYRYYSIDIFNTSLGVGGMGRGKGILILADL